MATSYKRAAPIIYHVEYRGFVIFLGFDGLLYAGPMYAKDILLDVIKLETVSSDGKSSLWGVIDIDMVKRHIDCYIHKVRTNLMYMKFDPM